MLYERIASFLQDTKRIGILCHRNPDGDAIGSLLAMHMVLEKTGRQATPICFDHVPEAFSFLRHADQVVTEFSPDDYDGLIFVDTADIETLSGFYPRYKTFFATQKLLNIDHHPSNKFYGTINLVEADKASTTVVLYDLFTALHISLDPAIATALLTGLITDTGGFQHSNTTEKVLAVAADLVDKGARQQQIMKQVFHSRSLPMLRLWGRVLEKSRFEQDYSIVWSLITQQDLRELSATTEDLSGAISLLYGVPEADIAVLLTEKEDHRLKASIRTKNGADANALAGFFGGGGHRKAAGFLVDAIETNAP